MSVVHELIYNLKMNLSLISIYYICHISYIYVCNKKETKITLLISDKVTSEHRIFSYLKGDIYNDFQKDINILNAYTSNN